MACTVFLNGWSESCTFVLTLALLFHLLLFLCFPLAFLLCLTICSIHDLRGLGGAGRLHAPRARDRTGR